MVFDEVIKSMDEYYTAILKSNRISLNSDDFKNIIPNYQGVYVILLGNKKIYVGKAKSIKRRFIQNHLSKKTTHSYSSFRDSLVKNGYCCYNDSKDWLLANCNFKFLKIENYDDVILFEALLIKLWRKDGLLNHEGKYSNSKIIENPK